MRNGESFIFTRHAFEAVPVIGYDSFILTVLLYELVRRDNKPRWLTRIETDRYQSERGTLLLAPRPLIFMHNLYLSYQNPIYVVREHFHRCDFRKSSTV